jgi:hypothetical protein
MSIIRVMRYRCSTFGALLALASIVAGCGDYELVSKSELARLRRDADLGKNAERRVWVLWWHGSLAPGGAGPGFVLAPAWHPLESYSSQDDCKLGEAMTKKKSPQFAYVCLPDTLSPRGPRASN